ncbi:DUF3048 domain-containing protein [Calidifontibacillus erzurumensis]|uniref:DUF3048 domain-containing protein n=1 Tax=Calidifontibacillus erzurumensis TaxID=2741433 RepID=A0A8J8GGZ1_9BACI|nr:DUF3048 domain-containing protein [Calidifontibacillus erzurumensis]NSL53021.1 DUF3048 domain-containing protein [Calidifontibacillus erzurumensis]
MKNPIKMIAVGTLSALLLSGCNFGTKNAIEQPAINYLEPDKRLEILKKQDIPFTNYFPFTGLGAYGDVNQRPFAVMVNNHPSARPQSGLYKADLVYEILAEGSITRFLAVYQSELPDVVGPIRSARDYYIYLSKGLEAIYVAYGGSPEAFDLLQHKEIIDYIGGIVRKGYADDQFFYRSDSRKAPHNVYTTKENLIKGAEKRNFSLTQDVEPLSFLSEEEMVNIDGQQAEEVQITYSKSYETSFVYDEDAKNYVRYVNGTKSMDRETKTPISVENILIIEAPHRVVDSTGRRDIDFVGGGKGYLIHMGILQEIEWKNKDGRIIPFDYSGQEARLVPGKTWINVIPTKPGLEKSVSYK